MSKSARFRSVRRHRFFGKGALHAHAQSERRPRLSEEQARAETRRMKAINPGRNPRRGKKSRRYAPKRFKWERSSADRDWRHGKGRFRKAARARRNPGVFATVSEAVRSFKHQYGGQAYGWAQDAVSTARTAETAQFWRQVLAVLRREVYRTNPKRGRKSRRWSVGVRRKQEHRFATVYGKVRSGENKKAWRRLERHGRGGFARSNPKRGRKSRRVRFDRYEGVHNFHGRRIERARHKASRHGRRLNPKRDGTPTRGELRKDKYKDHLRKLRERGQAAADELNKLLGRGVHKPRGEAVLEAPTTETQLAHPGHFAASQSDDQRAAEIALGDVEAAMKDIRAQMQEVEDEAIGEELSTQLIKLGQQRKALQERARGGAAMSNPRRRNPRYASPARYARMSHAQRARYRNALRRLRMTVRGL